MNTEPNQSGVHHGIVVVVIQISSYEALYRASFQRLVHRCQVIAWKRIAGMLDIWEKWGVLNSIAQIRINLNCSNETIQEHEAGTFSLCFLQSDHLLSPLKAELLALNMEEVWIPVRRRQQHGMSTTEIHLASRLMVASEHTADTQSPVHMPVVLVGRALVLLRRDRCKYFGVGGNCLS